MHNLMNSTALAVGMGAVLLVLVIVAIILSRRPRRANTAYYAEKWQELQKLLRDQATWPLAIIDADTLLDEALKARKYKGKSMG